jgi:hypothetical protein
MTRATRSPHRVARLFALSIVMLALFPRAGFGQADDDATKAILTQDGWWNRAAGPQDAEPANPVRPVIGGVIPAPSTVPANAIAVGALLGEPDKVAAVGFILEAPPDAFADALVLTLKEVPDANANVNVGGAAIVACPITSFWAGVRNGEFRTRPTCDEAQSVTGTRAATGIWTFDLTLMALGWLDSSTGLAQNGVLLQEAAAAPVSFQVSFGDISTGSVVTNFAATGGGFSASSDFELEDQPALAEEPAAGDTAFAAAPSADSGLAGGASAATAAPVALPPPSGQAAVVASGIRATGEGSLFGNLSIAALLLLALLTAGTALLLGLVLGPLAAPEAARVRSGGVSRALAAREAARASGRPASWGRAGAP